jgi:hypothetical protein
VRIGACSTTAYGQTNGRYEGFQFGSKTIQIDDTPLLIEPGAAKLDHEAQAAAASRRVITNGEQIQAGGESGAATAAVGNGSGAGTASTFVAQASKCFHSAQSFAQNPSGA